MRLPAPDKVLHFAAGNMAVPISLVVEEATGVPSRLTAVPIAFSLGFAREVYNVVRGGPFSWADILATTLGAVPYALTAQVISTVDQLSLTHEG